jgi:hypothetical protein
MTVTGTLAPIPTGPPVLAGPGTAACRRRPRPARAPPRLHPGDGRKVRRRSGATAVGGAVLGLATAAAMRAVVALAGYSFGSEVEPGANC